MPETQDGHPAMNIAPNTPLLLRNYDYDTRRYASSISSSSSSSRSITPTFESRPTLYDPQQQHQDIDSSQAEPDEFILTVLKKPQDRIFLLSLERDLESFINNPKQYRLDLPPMNSYQRLMVHKVAPYFKLNHYHDPARKAVFLCKNQYTQLPPVRLPDLVEQEQNPADTMPQFKIMRRALPSHSPHTNRTSRTQERKTMTLEERKAAYEEARARIFQDLEKSSD
ncbi:hypothetical protein EC973_003342 [Apophysomyces ossiformis]|uniref:R3H domain-containing protein n=1 Tax=Apophysomyces ossiformis TaxID=679940 RepID=A0A8H7BZR3_9FUNG|nr:hypothetical protein EC973_003342 [Apophysomyces ossiformis]